MFRSIVHVPLRSPSRTVKWDIRHSSADPLNLDTFVVNWYFELNYAASTFHRSILSSLLNSILALRQSGNL